MSLFKEVIAQEIEEIVDDVGSSDGLMKGAALMVFSVVFGYALSARYREWLNGSEWLRLKFEKATPKDPNETF